MSTDAGDDKYPGDTGRRRFVKGVVGGASLAAIGTTGVASINSATSAAGEGGGTTEYFGIENTDGPAPRGMPQIPIEIDGEGAIKGVWPKVTKTKNKQGETVTKAEVKLGGITYSSQWYQYCGLQSYEGIQPDADVPDNYFHSSSSASYSWQQKLEPGAKFHVSDFEDYKTWNNDIGKKKNGKPALGTWRTPEGAEELVIQLLRSEQIEKLAQGNSEHSKWINASTEKGIIAWMDKCTHFCCVPGFKVSAQSKKFGAENEVYCPCHQSVYDPHSIKKLQYTALPRPED